MPIEHSIDITAINSNGFILCIPGVSILEVCSRNGEIVGNT